MCSLKFPSLLAFLDFPNDMFESKLAKDDERAFFYSILNRKCMRKIFAYPDFISLLYFSMNFTYFRGHTRPNENVIQTSFLAEAYSRLS